MDILEFAMQMEKDGETYYRNMAEGTTEPGFAGVFKRLAETEVRHYDVLAALKEEVPASLSDDTIPADAKNIFAELIEAGKEPQIDPNAIDKYVEQYKFAQGVEAKSRDFYREKADECCCDEAKAIFLRLADEEEKHIWVLENIIESVSRPSFNWIEFAEWHHSEEY
ncbi:MAG: ferritin family protein [Lentisphaerae bacterium]|jgi:rubrerythrin|nr:ferritin family protein [Lentisphaerota bacterium]MBT4820798.1 ferritin family protein [Lentisphaerota bacterium]MBT5608100.1 ferritin family protein [Lentisphaerota bacterium]MBT7060623.1 ferritin family protein [Lentisphaerota bacterium]MBT7847722.1 ferritin family protein [Lentisphaerota bacterium]